MHNVNIINKKKLAIIIPGIGYSIDRPLLYYSGKIAKANGYEVVSIEYHSKIKFDRDNLTERKLAFQGYYEQLCHQLKQVSFDQYTQIVFISKSIGTVLASKYCNDSKISAINILYTPLEEIFNFNLKNGICVTGTADPWLDHAIYKKKISATFLNSIIVENANHSLETGDIFEDLRNLEMILKKTEQILRVEIV